MGHGVDDIARPGFSLSSDHRRAFADSAECLADVPCATDVGHFVLPLVYVVLVVGRRQHFGLVAVVDPQGFKYLCFDKVTDTGLCHDWDGDGIDDA